MLVLIIHQKDAFFVFWSPLFILGSLLTHSQQALNYCNMLKMCTGKIPAYASAAIHTTRIIFCLISLQSVRAECLIQGSFTPGLYLGIWILPLAIFWDIQLETKFMEVGSSHNVINTTLAVINVFQTGFYLPTPFLRAQGNSRFPLSTLAISYLRCPLCFFHWVPAKLNH